MLSQCRRSGLKSKCQQAVLPLDLQAKSCLLLPRCWRLSGRLWHALTVGASRPSCLHVAFFLCQVFARPAAVFPPCTSVWASTFPLYEDTSHAAQGPLQFYLTTSVKTPFPEKATPEALVGGSG